MENKKNKILLFTSLFVTIGLIISFSFAQNLTNSSNLFNETITNSSYGAQSITSSFIISSPGNLEDGLYSHYDFNGDLNNEVSTEIASSHGGALLSSGKIDQGYYFDGINDYISTPLGLSNAISISFWVNIHQDQLGDMSYFIWKDGSGNSRGDFNLNFQTNNKFRFDTQNGGTSQSFDELGQVLNANEWYHITFSYYNGIKKGYVNGVEVLNSAYSFDLIDNDKQFTIGGYPNFAFFKGNIDEFSVWNRELSNSEVLQLYNNGEGMEYDSQAQLFKPNNQFIANTDAITIIKEEFTNSSLSLTNPQENVEIAIDYINGTLKESSFDLFYVHNSKRYFINYNKSNQNQMESIGNTLNILQIEPTTEEDLRTQIQNLINQ